MAVVALHPLAGSVRVVLLLPNWDTGLNLVDDVLAGCKGRFAVGGADSCINSQSTYAKISDPVLSDCFLNLEFLQSFLDDASPFSLRERNVALVAKSGDVLSFVVITHPALEGSEASGTGIEDSFPECVG